VDAPIPLPASLFLLAYDPAKGRLTSRGQLGLIMQAATLAELFFAGHLVDQDGLVGAAGNPKLDDPVQAAVFADVVAGRRPRRWQYWVQHHRRKFPDLVRDQLIEARLIRAEKRRVLGLFTLQTITLRDARARGRLADRVRRALRGGEPVDRVDLPDAAMVALAAAGELNLLVDRRQRREYKRRIESLSERVGPAAPALRKALTAQKAAAASASG
jgi:hypothetical protein